MVGTECRWWEARKRILPFLVTLEVMVALVKMGTIKSPQHVELICHLALEVSKLNCDPCFNAGKKCSGKFWGSDWALVQKICDIL
ncbi:hypothetical protein Pelo_9272 [Pelomyxa schiedti]|nr:hypothetical protein Pelo_9272 [Pelomyxa schiedti]